MKIQILSTSLGYVDAIVDHENKCCFHLTGFYGNLETSLREFLWDLLRKLVGINNLSWFVIGDFNKIIHFSEKLGGKYQS